MIHIYKNIYKQLNKKINKKLLYALISVEQPSNKPNSLVFSIDDGYNTPSVENAELYDPEIQSEMNVIITVLNRIFDEDNNDYYIGNTNTSYINLNKVNAVLNNINKHTIYFTRKNYGKSAISSFINNKRNMKRKTRRHYK